jgi:hypothetical protein
VIPAHFFNFRSGFSTIVLMTARCIRAESSHLQLLLRFEEYFCIILYCLIFFIY